MTTSAVGSRDAVCGALVALGWWWFFFSFSFQFLSGAGVGVKLPVGWLACVSWVTDDGVQLPFCGSPNPRPFWVAL